jgi:hypothetical protein
MRKTIILTKNFVIRISAVLNAEGNTRPPSLPVDTSALPVTATKSLGMMATLNSLIDNDPETSRRNKVRWLGEGVLGEVGEKKRNMKSEIEGRFRLTKSLRDICLLYVYPLSCTKKVSSPCQTFSLI